VQHLYLFGSPARDDARPESDVDLFLLIASAASLACSIDGRERVRGRASRLQGGRHNATKPASCLAQTDRDISVAGILMADHAAGATIA
jgi:predicted nucleotidyltransferase